MINLRLKNIRDSLRVTSQISNFSLQTLVRSCYISRKHTNRWSSLIIGEDTICDIAPNSEVCVDSDSRLLFATGDREFEATHHKLGKSKLRVESGAQFHITSPNARIGPCSVVHVGGSLSIGASYFNSHARILCNNSISIGDGCAIAWNVQLLDDNYHKLQIDGRQTTKSEPIVINDNVWVGNNVLVKKGVNIGEGAVIGSGSVVTDDIPAETLAVGNPAEVIRDDVSWQ